MFTSSNGQILGLFQVIGEAINSTLGKFIANIIMPGINLINSVYLAICKSIYASLIIPIMRICDICQLVFRKFAGIENMQVTTTRSNIFGASYSSDDIIMNLISSSIVQRIFLAMLVLAIVMLVITTFVANIKVEFNSQDKNGGNRKTVFKNAFRGLMNFVAVPVISIFAIMLSNGLLKAVDGATNLSGQQTYLSGQLFVACAYNGNRVRNSQNNESDTGNAYKAYSFGALITGEYETGIQNENLGIGNFGIFLDDAGVAGLRAADKIDNAFATGRYLTITEDSLANQLYYGPKLDTWNMGADLGIGILTTLQSYTQAFSPTGAVTTLPAGYKGGAGYLDMDITPDWGSFIIGKGLLKEFTLHYITNTYAGGDYGHITFSVYDIGLVSYYYDITLTSFNYLIFLIAGIYFAYAFIVTAVGLIKRLFMLTLYFIISPPICALYPIDNGSALGKWRVNFVKEMLSAYSVVIVMNIFLSLLPLFTQIQVFNAHSIPARILEMNPLLAWWVDPSWLSDGGNGQFITETVSEMLSPAIGLVNGLIRVLIIAGALHFFKKAVSDIAGIIGAGDAFGEGNDVAKKLANTVAGAATMAVGGGALLAAKAKAGKLAKMNKAAADTSGDSDTGSDKDEGEKIEKPSTDPTSKADKMSMNGGSDKSTDKVSGKDNGIISDVSDLPIKLNKDGIVDGRTKAGKMLKSKGLEKEEVKLTKTGQIDGRSKLGKKLASMKTMKAKPSDSEDATKKDEIKEDVESKETKKAESTGSGASEKKSEQKAGFYKRFVKFAERVNSIKRIATGNSGVAETNKSFAEFGSASNRSAALGETIKEAKKNGSGPKMKEINLYQKQLSKEERIKSNLEKELKKGSKDAEKVKKAIESTEKNIEDINKKIKQSKSDLRDILDKSKK